MKEKEKIIRDKIIDALMELLYKKELGQIKADEIAEVASVSKRTLYKYYETKTAMYLSVVASCFSDMNLHLEKSVEGFNKKADLKVLERMAKAYLNYMISNPQKGKIIIFFNERDYMIEYPEIVKNITIEANRYEPIKYFREYFKTGKNKTEFSAESLAIHVHSTIFGLSLLLQTKRYWLESYFGKSAEEIAEDTIKILMKSLGGNENEEKG